MAYKKIAMEHDKKIALIAHDNKKRDLIEWAKYNRDLLAHHKVYATGTTGALLERELGFAITKLQSGPLGGDQQIGARIADGEVDFMIFFSDPLEQQAHDPDIKALLRMAIVWNIPIACNRASADFMISSPLMEGEYDRLVPDYEEYRTRNLKMNGGNGQDAGDYNREIREGSPLGAIHLWNIIQPLQRSTVLGSSVTTCRASVVSLPSPPICVRPSPLNIGT